MADLVLSFSEPVVATPDKNQMPTWFSCETVQGSFSSGPCPDLPAITFANRCALSGSRCNALRVSATVI